MSEIKCITGEPIMGDTEEQKQAQQLANLRWQVAQLQSELSAMSAWPDEMTPEERKSGRLTAWRNRALIAECKLAAMTQRCLDLDQEVADLKNQIEVMA
ncbi:MAG: hypothetical protein KGL39_25745 [Patescibacteria group bacterium]|nr:hypothetical protein [Patescibacteria group bacterium]